MLTLRAQYVRSSPGLTPRDVTRGNNPMMDERANGCRLNAADIRSQLERILRSRLLQQAPRLASFLHYVVEETLAGRADRIKAYTVGLGALGRSAEFDPITDPIVRVEAVRLRRALSQYYASDGRQDPIEIAPPTDARAARRFRGSPRLPALAAVKRG
jgi:hypothetical protein